MNALVANDQQSHPSRVTGVGKALASVESKLLAPWDACPFSSEEFRRASLAVHGSSTDLRAMIKDRLHGEPSKVGAVGAYAERLDIATTAAPSRQEARALLGILVSAYPAGQARDLDAYLDAMLHDVVECRFPSAVVAAACRKLRRTVKFLPAISEVLDACREELETVQVRLRIARTMLSHLELIESAVERQSQKQTERAAFSGAADGRGAAEDPSPKTP